MIVPSKFNGYNKDGTRNLFLGGGGGGGQTTSTVQNTNIPEYARPYVETMLGATQEQLFQGTRGPDVTNPETGAVTRGDFNITGFKPYQAYGGQYDAQGNAILGPDGKPIYDAGKAVAGFSPMQTAAQQGIAGMKMPTSDYANANYAIQHAGLGANQSATQAYIYGQEGAKSGALGQQLGLAAAADAQALAKEQAGRANKFGDAGFASGQKGQELGIAGGQLGIAGGAKYGDMGAGYGAQGAGYGSQAAGLAGKALGYGDLSSQIGQMGLQAQQTGQGITDLSKGYAAQQAGAGSQYAQMATDPRVTKALMNPYTQNVLDVQNEELNRQGKIATQARGAQAVRAGAFGGSRQAIEDAEADRNLATIKNANTAQAYQQAFQNAQAQQQFGANLNLQGLSGAQQGLGTALSGGQLGLSGIGTALQGQQGALAGVGAANQAYQTGIQGSQAGIAGANTGLQGVNTQLAGVDRQLAGTAQGMQGAQVGLAGVGAATNAGQLGLQGAQTGLQGTAQGMQGAQIGLQGVSGAQAGYGLLGQSGMNLTNMLGQKQQQELGIYGAQSTAGAQQQALEQAKINQAMQDYANAQQYPLMQLGTMSNMLRGLPMQASTTNQYAAAPSAASQAIGTIGSGASIYNAMKPGPGGAAGGLPSEFKYAKGGIASVPSYDMGGEVEEQLESMDEKGLAAQARESSSPSIRRMAQRLLRERQMGNKPQGTGPMGVQYQAAQPQMPSYKPGGIVAFAAGDTVYGGPSTENDPQNEEDARIGMQQRLDQPAPTTGGIMGATTQPTTPIPVAPAGPSPDVVKEAMRQRDLNTAQATRSTADVIKEIQAERDASGIGDNKAREEYRSQQMAERANLADEKERQRHMRLAEFFASWGSTPGPVLVAGMNALKQSIPGLITDEKEAKKARKEADKIIYDIDEATRLDKLGLHNEATARREKAAKYAEEYNKYLLTFQSQREANEKSLEVARIQAKGQTDSAAMRNASDRSGRLQTEALRNEDRIFGRYQAATKEYDSVVANVAKQESQDAHKNDLKKLEQYTAGAKDRKTGEIIPEKINKEYKVIYAETLKRVNDRKESWETAIKDARNEKDLAFSRVKGLSSDAIEARTGPKATATDSGEATTGSFSTPTAAHIALLKKNPGEKAAFDAKFGPGAANEYLGN